MIRRGRKPPWRPELWLALPANAFGIQIVSDGGFNANGPSGNPNVADGSVQSIYAIHAATDVGRFSNAGADFSSGWFDLDSIPGRRYDLSADTVTGTGGNSGNGRMTFSQQDGTQLGLWTTAGNHAVSNILATGNLLRVAMEPMNQVASAWVGIDNLSLIANNTFEGDTIFAMVKELGFKGVRADFQSEWVFFGSSAGRFWTAPDNIVNRARAAGLKVIFVETSTPAWAQPAGGNGGSYIDAAQAAAYASCMQDAASRYGSAVLAWEIRNEMNIGFSQLVGTGASIATCATAYVVHSKTVIGGLRAGNPKLKFISHGLSPSPDTVLGSHLAAVDFLREMYINGGVGVFDGIGFHPYSWPLQTDDPASYNGWNIMERGIRDVMGTYGEGHKPVFATEYGFPTGGTGGNTEADAGKGIKTAVHLMRKRPRNVPVLCYYSDKDRHASDFGSVDTEDFFGGYTAALTKKQAVFDALYYGSHVLGSGRAV